MKIAIPAEADSEPRVAATPDTVKKMKTLGADVVVQAGAGAKSGVLDADYEAAGATIAPSASDATKDADVVLKVRRPTEAEAASYKPGALVMAIMDPYGNEAALAAMAKAGVVAFEHGTVQLFLLNANNPVVVLVIFVRIVKTGVASRDAAVDAHFDAAQSQPLITEAGDEPQLDKALGFNVRFDDAREKAHARVHTAFAGDFLIGAHRFA